MTAPEVSAELDKWNMEINPSLKTALGRVLNPETIYLKTETTYQSSNADWGNSKYMRHIWRKPYDHFCTLWWCHVIFFSF